jgi:UDP-2,3-diacylglucosamine pyrophosphatase LpxH
MHEKLFVVSDIEMGRGDIVDDFGDDDQLVEFIAQIGKTEPDTPVTLILNGDIFDFLKMPYKDKHPHHITEKISLWKLNEVFKKHPKVIEALKRFLHKNGHKIHFVIGNHDADVIWPEVQEKIKKHLDAGNNVTFGYYYERPGIHIEHGHLHDPLFMTDVKRAFTKHKGINILNIPFGAKICFTHLINFKKDFPYEEKLFPKHMIFDIKPELKKRQNKMVRDIILKDVILNPVFRFYDRTNRVPYFKLLRHLFSYGSKIMDNAMFLPLTIRTMVKKHPGSELYILGHAHLMAEYDYKNRKILITDTWRNEYDLNRNSEKKKKSYAEIDYEDDHVKSAHVKVF